MATSGLTKSRNLLARKRLQRQSVRRVLLESLEARQLLAVGPQLLGIQPNTSDLLSNGEILNISPRELVFRFDDNEGIDPATLDGIRIVRSGDDGVFERASAATDFGTGGQTLVEFYAREPGETGNGIRIEFTSRAHNQGRAPIITVNDRTIRVELNSNPVQETRVEDLLQAFDPQVQSPATSLAYALRLRGSQLIGIGNSAPRTLVLDGANAAKASTNFNISNTLEVRFTAKDSGNAGIGIQINVTARDRGGAGNPIVSVNNKVINVEINSNSRFPTTVQEFIDAINASDSASSSLVEAKLVSGVGATRLGSSPVTYSPIELGGVSDIEIVPAYAGLGDTDREVILRFAEALPDDRYRIEILGQGSRTLRNLSGEAFNNGRSQAVNFELDLGAQIKSVVPQPVIRNAGGQLVQQRNKIEVYFNDDDLIDVNSIVSVNGIPISELRQLRDPLFFDTSDAITFASGSGNRSVLEPEYFQLFHTADSLTNADDVRILPASVRYFPSTDRVSLTFNRNLDQLIDPGSGNPLPISKLRLRIGNNEEPSQAPATFDGKSVDPADTFDDAQDLSSVWTPGAGGTQSIVIDAEIDNPTPLLLDFPGDSAEPGNRTNRFQDNLRLGADTVDGTSVINYNFQTNLGVFSNTNLVNAITEQQKQRVREILSIYEQYLGVRFVETESLGLTVAVGDMRAIVPFEDVVGSGVPGVVEFNGPGGTYYEAGTLISNGQLGTVLDLQDFSDSSLSEFGGPFQRAAMQAVGRLLGLGLADEAGRLTIQSFEAAFAPGVGTEIILPGDADIVHGQFLYRPDSKDIDLYQFALPVDGRISIEAFAERMNTASLLDAQIRLYQQDSDGAWHEIASNDDYYSSDSYLELDLEQGNYIVGVSASGNRNYDPTISDTGIGGRSEGDYQLRLDFQPPAEGLLRDGTGVPIDGNADGSPEGVFNFWFLPAGPGNTKFVDKAAAAGGNGSLATPYQKIADALRAAKPGDVVRIVGNGGADGQLATTNDNLAYEIGFNSLGRPLPDGATLDVPAGVSVMIDSGAILKMRRSRVGVGSTSVNVDRSGGSLLVLGTPALVDNSGNPVLDAVGATVPGSVYFTSLNDSQLGAPSSSNVTGASAVSGDWGGIDFRSKVDNSLPGRKSQEELGQFLNWVSNADVRYGGGQVVVDGVLQSVSSIQMIDARPSINNSTISRGSGAALSATPDSFLESNFHSPAEQEGLSFTVDYDRVGPDLNSNRVVNNAINGIQIRVQSPSDTEVKMTVPGRFDDADIVHYLAENLVVQGTPGGAVLANEGPASTAVQLTLRSGGNLAPGAYNYRLTRVDSSGVESTASEPTATISRTSTGSVVLSNLPANINRVYRSTASGQGPYELVGEFQNGSTVFIDTGVSTGIFLSESLDVYDARLDARLAVDAGVVVKLNGARIDVDFGAQLIAEGDDGNPVVFTSLNDTRYGAGGTFQTANNPNESAAEGDWGGIYVGHTSSASLDHAVVSYGGGTTRIEGGFADFNPLEIHQGTVRVANSRFEFNAAGSQTATDPDRGGRGTNDEATIFVRGAQPILANNIVQDNLGAAFSINVSALNSNLLDDYGRSTGMGDRFESIVGNQGPLVALNKLDDNDINGLVVRGGELTTEGVWDDTDIVHVVLDEIVIPDHQHFSGLRLTSADNESLVVKLSGADTGLTATGTPLDNDDRIGGSIQVVGNDAHPVIMTSLDDCSVGAGFTVTGQHQVDTNNTGFCTDPDASVDYVDVLVVMDESASMAFAQQFAVGFIADLDTNLQAAGIGNSSAGTNLFGLVGFGSATQAPRAIPVGAGGELWGTSVEYATASGNLLDNGAVEDGYQAIHFALDNYDFREDAEKFIILVTNEDRDVVDASLTYANTLARLEAEGVTLEGIISAAFVDEQGFLALALDSQFNAYSADGNGGFTVSPNGDVLFGSGTTITDYVDMIFETRGIAGDINQIAAGGLTAESFGNAVISSIVVQAGGNPAAAGDWRSVLLDTYSNDRNVSIVTETESPLSDSPSTNETPDNAQFIGALAPHEYAGDENNRLGFQLEGQLSRPGDVDVYSFRAQAGTEVWLDIDRTNNSLDTVVELVDADGRTLALSDSSLLEEADPSLLFAATDMPPQAVNPLRKSDPDFYYESALGVPKDLYSTNPFDAGMRVRLPGSPGATNLYHVRVRSSNRKAGDPLSQLLDPSLLDAGLTKGRYQLQIRLSEVDEVPGSGVSYAEIRFGTNGVELVGVPGNSPLTGENGEIESLPNGPRNDTLANAQVLGNLLSTNRQAISVSGSLDSFTDVDWYSFDIQYERITPTALREYFATVIDVDYADGIGRPDTSIYVFNASGDLILSGLSSNILDDQASPAGGADTSNLLGGSAGNLDPFIGSYELPAGQYFLAITNSNLVPAVMATYTDPNFADFDMRLQPIEGVELIAEDHISFQGGSTALPPRTPILFPQQSLLDFTLNDITLYVSRDVGQEQTNLYIVNPFTGEVRNQVGRGGFDVQDIDFRPNGNLRAFDRVIETNIGGNVDRDDLMDYIDIDWGTGAFTDIGDLGLDTTYLDVTANPPAAADADDGFNVEAITFTTFGGQERGFIIGNRPTPPGEIPSYSATRFIDSNNPAGFPGFTRPNITNFTNVIYEFDENTGVATSAPANDKQNAAIASGAGTAVRERGRIETFTLDGIGNIVSESNRLAAREVTSGSIATGPNFIISDGDRFVVRDGGNIPTTFEFNLGPEVLVDYDPASNNSIRDGLQFDLDGTLFEFDTGSIIVVDAFSGAQLADGSTVRIVNAGGVVTIFEFDNNSQVQSGNIAVPYTTTSSQASLVTALVDAINAQSSFGVRAEFVSGSNRISLINASTTQPVQVTGLGLSVDGGVGVTPGAVRIAVSEAASLNAFVTAIARSVPSSVTVGFEAGRMNFNGATSGSFTDLEIAGIFTDIGSSGNVSAGSIPVEVLASDSAETVAQRIAQAINDAGIPALSASANGIEVNLVGVVVSNQGPLAQIGIAPGGIVTGAAVIGTTMFAVSDAGGLYRVENPTAISQGNVGTYVETSYDLIGIPFSGLVEGPVHMQNGRFSQLLFGIDELGRIHAFNQLGQLQPVFANGATSVSTGLVGANGLSMPSLDFNLWHVDGQRGNDPGHGLPDTPNDSRVNTNGGQSLYFGFNNPGANGVPDLSGANSTGLADTYNFPGGAAGVLESAPFSLAGIAASDQPTLYFSYFFETETADSDLPTGNNADDYMRDSLRVYAAGPDGEYILLATNNDPAQGGSNSGFFDDEFDPALTGNPDVQPLFDNNANWRQARIPLDLFAGQEDVRLRIEFSTHGSFGYGLEGGRGPEIRTIAGAELADGETLIVNGTTFEIELGATLALPGGPAINNGDNVLIDGTRYVFTDGSLPVISPDVAVPYDASMSANEIAQALRTAILTSPNSPPVFAGFSFTNESNDTLPTAELPGVTGDSVRIVGSGEIGDNAVLVDAGEDVDLIRVDLQRGAVVTVDIDAVVNGSTLDSFLRVFDVAGTPLRDAFGNLIENDNDGITSDSRLTFTAPSDGIYYIGISGAGNQAYSPAVLNTATTGSTGNYEVTIDVDRLLDPIVADNRLQLAGASDVRVSNSAAFALQGSAGTDGVPVLVELGMSAAEVADALADSLAGIFGNGVAGAYPVRGNVVDLTGLVNYSSIDFITGLPTPSAFDLDPGPFGATTNFVGDAFGAFNTSTNFDGTTNNARPGALGAQNNDFEGVYLDDFIIGVAGRGEMVLRASGGNTNFIQDPQQDITNPSQPNLEILVGEYQFEIRGGDEYGIPTLDGFPDTFLVTESFAFDQ
ncbi:MAG: PPC domain-containing protein, partial [bacterium]|nr:PPC domain-containing protein [bacterium]